MLGANCGFAVWMSEGLRPIRHQTQVNSVTISLKRPMIPL